jgi:hypothetical protein
LAWHFAATAFHPPRSLQSGSKADQAHSHAASPATSPSDTIISPIVIDFEIFLVVTSISPWRVAATKSTISLACVRLATLLSQEEPKVQKEEEAAIHLDSLHFPQ